MGDVKTQLYVWVEPDTG